MGDICIYCIMLLPFCLFYTTVTQFLYEYKVCTNSKINLLPPLASPAAGHIVPKGQLKAYLTSAFGSGSHTVLLFLQDKVSPRDITTIFMCSYSSAIPALLQEKLGVSPLLVDADTLSHLSINTSASNLLLINLPYCTG
uniref:Uncharacterized protein n=1 Tax=Cyclopterus lumpus TaxID=8103 RepID=A0A8C3A1B2_CYCLU